MVEAFTTRELNAMRTSVLDALNKPWDAARAAEHGFDRPALQNAAAKLARMIREKAA